jgi:hypothetical protein
MEFMKRVMKGETVTELCREFGISRKTGDKFKQRFKRPHRRTGETPVVGA